MRTNSDKRSCGYVFGRLMFFVLLSNYAIAQDCDALKTSADHQLQEIGSDLVKVLTREQYEEAIQKRYDKVEDLLQIANECIKVKNNEDWNATRELLMGLRSNARELVFTKFENWMHVKEKDSALFKKTEVDKVEINKHPLSSTSENKTPAYTK